MKYSGVTLSLLLLLVSSLHAQPSSRTASVSVLRSDDKGVVLHIGGLRPELSRKGDRVRIDHNAPRYRTSADSTSLPGITVTVGVPSDAGGFSIAERDVARTTRTITGAVVNPVTTSPGARIGPLRTMRSMTTVSVSYSPLALAGSTLSVDTAVTLTLTWKRATDAAASSKEPAVENAAIDAALGAVIVNYAQAKRWARSNAPAMRLQSADGAWGIGEALVILVPRDGIWTVGADDAAGAGARSLVGSPIARIGLQHRGAAHPFHVADANGDGTFGSGDRIEFDGARNRGVDGTYFDAVSDTNAYILSWDGRVATPPRITDASLPAEAPAMAAYDSTLHFELDREFLLGFSYTPEETEWGGDIRTLHVPEQVGAERYYWTKVDGVGRASRSVRFDCAPVFDAGSAYRIRIRIANSTGVPVPTRFALNGFATIGSYTLPPRSDTIIDATIPANYLVSGPNDLLVEGTLGNDEVLRLYLDYVEISGRWMPSADAPSPRFRLPKNAVIDAPYRVRINGLATPPRVAVSDAKRVGVESSSPGVRFRLTSRIFLRGALRENHGFVAQFGDTVVRSGQWNLGLYFAEVDPAGRLVRSTYFPTRESAAQFDAAASFIASVPNGNFIVGGSAGGFGPTAVTQSLRDALASIGSTVLAGSGFENGAWAIVVRKGDIATRREAFTPLAGEATNGVIVDEWIASPQGTTYRAELTVSGAPGEEFVVGAPAPAGLRYHERDLLTGTDNRADLIIVTHPAFREASERLAAHRRLHGPSGVHDFAVKVVDVHTIYDEFGFGIKHQLPIRQFLQYADTFWTAPRPGYVALFGDASFDPERRLGLSKMIDYVPTFGEPASDYWYTMPFGGVNPAAAGRWPFDTATSFRQFIGRLPAMTPADADAMVDKIIDYDTTAPAEWNKRVVFIAGGQDNSEVDGNLQLAETLSGDYVMSRSFMGDTTIVARTIPVESFPSKPPHPDSRRAQEAMAEGGVWVNSAGHGSRIVLDLDFGMPEEIDNGDRYFVLGTFSCQTGAFSDVETSLRNEDFVKAPGRGAIAAYGATNWSYSDLNADIERNLFALMTGAPYVNNLGALTTLAKWSLFSDWGSYWMLSKTEGFRRRNHLLTYSLLGDPSLDLKISRHRELGFQDPAITNGTGADVSALDSAVVVEVDLWNYGRPILPEDADGDSAITVVATMIGPDRSERTDTVEVKWLARSTRVMLSMPLDGKPGEYTIRLHADPEEQVDEGYRADNIMVIPVRVRGNQPLPLEPVPHGRVASHDDVVIRLLNPPSGPGAEISVDTVPTFDSPAAFTNATVGSMTSDELVTQWTFSIPSSLRGATRFWWRAIATSGDPEIARQFPLVETFTVESQARAEFMLGGGRQLARSRVVGLRTDADGVGPGSRSARVEVRAVGQPRYPTGETINDQKISFRVDDGSGTFRELADDNQTGLHIAVLDPSTLEPLPGMYRVFYLFEREFEVDAVVAFVASIPEDHPVLVGTMARALDYYRTSPALQAALASLGARIDPDSVSAEDSYALIGGKGMPATQSWIFGEALRQARIDPPRYARALAAQSFLIEPSAGHIVTPTIGPATAWRSARLELSSTAAPPDVTVYGVRRDGLRDSLAYRAATTTIDLAGIDARQYPRIELRVALARDSTLRLRAIEVDYAPSPELAIVPRTIAVDRDSVLQGDATELAVTVTNLSRRYTADTVGVALTHRSLGEARDVATQTVTLAPLERREIRFDLVTDRLGATNTFVTQLNRADVPAEPYRHNNADTVGLRTSGDTARPKLAVYADGTRLMSGDFVNPVARFEIRLFDNSKLRVTDSTSIEMFLDDAPITLDSGARFLAAPGGDALAGLVYSVAAPGLSDGSHSITFRGVDASGNQTETEFVEFFVERALRLVETVNYPNPFAEQTEFTFRVAGGSPPTGGEIAIYTVAGRKVKTIRLGADQVHLGFNHIEWDGRDDDHDRLANGVYLYRVMVESPDGRVEVIEKLVVMK